MSVCVWNVCVCVCVCVEQEGNWVVCVCVCVVYSRRVMGTHREGDSGEGWRGACSRGVLGCTVVHILHEIFPKPPGQVGSASTHEVGSWERRGNRSRNTTKYSRPGIKQLLQGLCVHTGSSVLYFNTRPTSVFQITHV